LPRRQGIAACLLASADTDEFRFPKQQAIGGKFGVPPRGKANHQISAARGNASPSRIK